MRNIIFIFCCFFLGMIQMQAQISKGIGKDKKDNADRRIWYGGSVPFGVGFGNTTFIQLGVSPMFGYKITPDFSVGPRAGVLFSYFNQRQIGGRAESVQPVSWAAGVFSRYRFVEQFFAHVEYEYENKAVPFNAINGLDVQRFNAQNVYVGLGLLQGSFGAIRSEILLLYNVNAGKYYNQSPLSIRFGVNWHF